MSPLASVDVPASTANLGSGFDCFAAALSLKLRVELHEGSETGITLNAHGEGVPDADADPDQNLIIRAFREGMRAAMGAPMGSGAWRLEVEQHDPRRPRPRQLRRRHRGRAAARRQRRTIGATAGRPAGPGGRAWRATPTTWPPPCTAASPCRCPADDGSVTLRRFRVPEAWIPVLFIAAQESRTSEMRAALPAAVCRTQWPRARPGGAPCWPRRS